MADATFLNNIADAASPGVIERLDASIDCVKVISTDGLLLGINPEGQCLLEIDDFATLQGNAWVTIWPEDQRPMVTAAVSRAANGSVARFSASCPTAKGTPKHWDVLVSPLHDEAGGLTRLLAVSRDVTREVQLAGERALVTRELAHRIKNLFSVVDSVIGLSARADPASRPFARVVRERLVALGRAVGYVYGEAPNGEASNIAPTVLGLLGELLAPYGVNQADDRIRLDGDDAPISSGAVTAMALVINELATNALKYGALSDEEGKVAIETKVTQTEMRLVWAEQTWRTISPPTHQGFGTALLDRTISLQFRGVIERRWSGRGLTVTMDLPLDSLS